MKISELIPGAYYSYTPDEPFNREGIFLATKRTFGDALYLADTFWSYTGESVAVGWSLSNAELATADLLFDPADGWELAGRSLQISDFDDNDVRTVTSQGGLRKAQWIRTGSGPTVEKRLANARARTADARQKVDSAISGYGWAMREEQRLCDEINAAAAEPASAPTTSKP